VYAELLHLLYELVDFAFGDRAPKFFKDHSREYGQVFESASKILAKDPSNIEAHFARGFVYSLSTNTLGCCRPKYCPISVNMAKPRPPVKRPESLTLLANTPQLSCSERGLPHLGIAIWMKMT
jgi:hypothetical protein